LCCCLNGRTVRAKQNHIYSLYRFLKKDYVAMADATLAKHGYKNMWMVMR